MKFIGIDPGLTGAIAVVDETGMIAEVYDMPSMSLGKKNVISESGLAQLLRDLCMGNDCKVYVEKVHSMPGQGVASSFNFGMGFGIIKGCLAMIGTPYDLITPQAWKKAVMAGQSREKDASRQVAQRLFPDMPLHLKKHHGRADALLIAEYGRRQNISVRMTG